MRGSFSNWRPFCRVGCAFATVTVQTEYQMSDGFSAGRGRCPQRPSGLHVASHGPLRTTAPTLPTSLSDFNPRVQADQCADETAGGLSRDHRRVGVGNQCLPASVVRGVAE